VEKSEISSCLAGVIFGAIVGGVTGIALYFGLWALAAIPAFVFFGYFLGAILENLESLNIQLNNQRRGK
jgi:high-affinity Fe2+/Pb2+ permease